MATFDVMFSWSMTSRLSTQILCRIALQVAKRWGHFEMKDASKNWIGFWATREVDKDSIDVVLAWRGTVVRTRWQFSCIQCKSAVHARHIQLHLVHMPAIICT